VEAAEILRRRGFDVKLVVVGPPVAGVESEVVEWRYPVPAKGIAALLSRAKALVLPSSYEALPYTCLEAMACGTPVVVSSAVPEELVVDGFNGIRVGSLDPRDYADALERLLVDGELWSRLSRNGLEFVKRFDHVEVAKKYLSIIGGLRER
jgi:glycosyltransferase involved in cell wall biosynthesis